MKYRIPVNTAVSLRRGPENGDGGYTKPFVTTKEAIYTDDDIVDMHMGTINNERTETWFGFRLPKIAHPWIMVTARESTFEKLP